MIEYRRLRAPSEHATTLQHPQLAEANSLIERNAIRLAQAGNFVETPLADLSELARREIVTSALNYSRRYRDVDFSDRDNTLVVMAGHQPTLFHAGVWYKNFALSEIARSSKIIAINLVVDNDICGVPEIAVPILGDTPRFDWLRYDDHDIARPLESRGIINPQLFRTFQQRVEQAVRPWVDDPLINRLWPYTLELAKSDPRLASAIAGGRHRLESDFGLVTAEIPNSLVAGTESFARFAQEILLRIDEFRQIHNQVLSLYRQMHRIRSSSHPVPELKTHEDFFETPFWMWHRDDPQRRSLYVRFSNGNVTLSNLDQWSLEIPVANLLANWLELIYQNVMIRPKALTTTMFCRLAASDLFLHGIGGSKYDQLTDAIIHQFFAIEPPEYMTLTATMQLPTGVEKITEQDVTRIESMLRELQFHPEQHIDSPDDLGKRIISEKQSWIASDPPFGARLERHQGINRCNRQLAGLVADTREKLEAQKAEMVDRMAATRVARSREYSFCLFPETLPEQLTELATF